MSLWSINEKMLKKILRKLFDVEDAVAVEFDPNAKRCPVCWGESQFGTVHKECHEITAGKQDALKNVYSVEVQQYRSQQ